MKRIVITIELKEPIAKAEQPHILKSIATHLANVEFKESIQESISCASCQDALDICRVHVELKK